MGYFQVRYNSRVVNYDRRGFIRLATEMSSLKQQFFVIQMLTYIFTHTRTRSRRRHRRMCVFMLKTLGGKKLVKNSYFDGERFRTIII